MIIDVKNLKKRYKKEFVLKGINISIKKPKIIALVGPNGAGKTTLLNCITNLTSINEGHVKLLGKNNDDTSLFFDLSYLQDNRVLYEHLSGRDHLKFSCDVQKLPLSEIENVAKRVGMETYLDKKVTNYSLGMKQHLLVAMAIINKPKLLLLDEPMNGLDPTSAINIRNIILDLYKKGSTIILSSHNLDEIDRLTDHIYFMKDGKLLKESLQDLTTNEYFVTVNDVLKAEECLINAEIPVIVIEEKQLQFQESQVSLQTFIHTLHEAEISIKSIDRMKLGAENRYRQLFGGNYS